MLRGVTLSSIVRDEMYNLAGGVEVLVRRHVPQVENAVILDTGSVDGTYECLQKLSKEFSNLQVLQRPFDGFGLSRTYGLRQVTTPYALVLDADEHIIEPDFSHLQTVLSEDSLCSDYPQGYSFRFRNHSQPGQSMHNEVDDGLNPRLFRCSHSVSFKNDVLNPVYEQLYDGDKRYADRHNIRESSVQIQHYVPNREGCEAKYVGLYLPMAFGNHKSPSSISSFNMWKKPAV